MKPLVRRTITEKLRSCVRLVSVSPVFDAKISSQELNNIL